MQLSRLGSAEIVDGIGLAAESFGMVQDDLGCFRPYDGRVLVASFHR